MPFSGIVEGVSLSMVTASGDSVSARARWARRLTACLRGDVTLLLAQLGLCCRVLARRTALVGVAGPASSTGTASAARAALNDNRRSMRRG